MLHDKDTSLISKTTALTGLCLILLSGIAVAADPVASIAEYSGEVSVQPSGTANIQRITVNAKLHAGDTLLTGPSGRATLLLSDESLVQVNSNTRLALKSVDPSAGWLPASAQQAIQSVYQLLEGELWFRNKNPDTNLEIETPLVAIGVRGTEFVVRVVPDQIAEVDMLEGRILATNSFGSVEAISGEQVYVLPGAAPQKRLLLNPENAVQWTLLVPQLLSPQAVSAQDRGDNRYRAAGAVLADIEQGKLTDARSAISAAVNADPANAVMLTANAWLDLNSGRADRAAISLAEITAGNPGEYFAWQVYALALLTINKADDAQIAIQQALELNPDNAESHLIQSYIDQALFDLNAALAANELALQSAPDNLPALINGAKLSFGMGDIDAARGYAGRAVARNGSDPEVLNLTGFIELAGNDTRAAMEKFERAIAGSPGFSEAYLGLGLARMRVNDAKGALEAISTAVALDPTRSLYMSYWGRMLYELGRHERALQVLQRAAELDPRDPTPWFLQAIVLRDLNRYGESIEHYNTAVALNDNRAVYRSRELLDQDMAVRNVDLSIIFQEFEFNAWANRKAVAAVNDDYGNFGAHIMYAGALSRQENRDTAFLSETLQARILQPGNINSFSTFNEYTSFLEKPGVAGSVLLRTGSFDLRNLEADVYGALPEQNLAFEAAYVDARSDGWNGFNGDDLRDASGIVKWDASLQDSFMLAVSDFSLTEYDDGFRRFEYDDTPRPTYQTDTDLNRYELGYTHNLKPGTDLLAYLAYIDLTSAYSFTEVVSDFSDATDIFFSTGSQQQYNDRSSWQAQLVYSSRLEQHEVIFGTINYFGKNDVRRLESGILTLGFVGDINPPSEFPIGSWDVIAPGVPLVSNNDRNYNNVFAQDTWYVNNWLDLEAALYYDYMKNSEPLVDSSWTIRKLNPRVGAVIRPNDIDTIRLAAIRYLAPFFSAQLSPTEIAGLTVYRNAQESAQTKELDATWERDWGKGFGAVNIFSVHTEVEGRPVPNIDEDQGPGKFDDPFVFIGKGQRKGVEMELNQRIGDRFGLAGRYLIADVTDEWLPDSDRNERRIEAGLRYIHPSGVFAGILQGHRHLDMDNRTSNETMNYTDVDLSYQLPNRTVKLGLLGRNIFDSNFNWVTDQFTLGGVIPERSWLLTFEVNL